MAPYLPLFLALLLSSSLSPSSACTKPNAIEISSSVRVYSDIDWKYNCHTMLAQARKYGGTRINFIPTHFFLDTDDDKIPNGFAVRMGRGQYVKPTKEVLAQYTKAMTSCFKKAVALGYDWIEVTPHLDDGDFTKDLWRNEVIVDPFEVYGGLTYVQLLIDPLTDALIEAVPASVNVHISIQGEMNAVLINHPKKWTQLITYIKQKFAAGAKFKAKVGINNNFNKICAACPTETNWAPEPGQFDLAAIGLLYQASDFIAISAYAPVDATYPKLSPADLENSINVFSKELSQFGVSFKKLMAAGKGFHYSEFGIGGGIGDGSCPQGCPVKTGLQAAKYPFQGIGGAYNPAKDPWATPDVREFMELYYKTATTFAAAGTGGEYKVDAIFIWNAGSYDCQGVYPASTVRVKEAIGTYKNDVVVSLISNYNEAC